jgi:sRNA-binding protein
MARQREEYQHTHQLLERRWPLIFGFARPLRIGIFKILRDELGRAEVTDTALKQFLKVWTLRPAYRAALKRGDRRVNLDGSDAGPPFEPPQNHRGGR